jgi:lipoprotein-anchoring transpeptidase ErfK/SrfK
MTKASKMVPVRGLNSSVASRRFWRVAVLTAAGAVVTGSHANAALYYWRDPDSAFYWAAPTAHSRYQNRHRHSAKKEKATEKETVAKPQAPLIIAVSIKKQQVKIYDANGFFAEAPVSTGMPGHSTPMGVFSIIQKQKWHRSNIYSGAPMPYMQRITWSGVAMHAGVLPGYPASHGCIRMPPAFAVKMYGWTRMGARVIVIPGELTPESFAHPLLPALKVVPQPVVAETPSDARAAAKSDKGPPGPTPAATEAKLELRSTVGSHDVIKPSANDASLPLRDQTHTADAGTDASDIKSAVTISDASSGNDARSDATAGDASETAKGDATKDSGAPGATSAAKPSEAAASEDKPAALDVADKADIKQNQADVASKADGAATKPAAATKPGESIGANVKPDEKAASVQPKAPEVDAKPQADAAKVDPAKADPAKPGQTAGKAADASKDQSRPADAPAFRPLAPKRAGPIAVFISRKDSKLYVRQNFAPLFQVPVTIAASDRPLGTHVFTADVDKTDPNVLHWSVVSLPMSVRTAMRNEDHERVSARRKSKAAAVEAKPLPEPDSPSEALDRITIPPDVAARIADAMTTGSSIVVSDQGINQGETGEGTDFIVSLR